MKKGLVWMKICNDMPQGVYFENKCFSFNFSWLYFCPKSSLELLQFHYGDVIMTAMASLITGVSIVYSAVFSGADQRKRQRSAPLAFVRGIDRWLVNSPHKGPVTRKMFPFDYVMFPGVAVGIREHTYQIYLADIQLGVSLRLASSPNAFPEVVNSWMVCPYYLICSLICVRNLMTASHHRCEAVI